MKYIALLRGINVGGKNKVVMKELKAAYEQAGFTNVVTYINSGNIIFDSAETDAAVVRTMCERLLAEDFGLEVVTNVISAEVYREALAQAPVWWNRDPEAKHNAIFLIPPLTVAEALAAVGAAKPEYEQIGSAGPVIFWTAPLKTFSRTRWSKVVGTGIYPYITIRNANTAIRLLEYIE